jgi:hypothetical protein
VRDERAQESVAGADGVIVSACAVDYAVDEECLDVVAAAGAPAHADFLTDELEIEDSAGVDVEPVRAPQIVQF